MNNNKIKINIQLEALVLNVSSVPLSANGTALSATSLRRRRIFRSSTEGHRRAEKSISSGAGRSIVLRICFLNCGDICSDCVKLRPTLGKCLDCFFEIWGFF